MKHILTALLYLVISFPVFCQETLFIEGELIIQLENGQQVEKLVYDINHDYYKHDLIGAKKLLSKRLNIWLLQFDAGKADMDAIIAQFYRHKGVIAAQKNHLVSPRSSNMPNDSIFGIQWDMNNTGQSGGIVGADIDALKAWDSVTGGVTALGDTIVVAVIDGRFDLNHEDLDFFKNRREIPNNNIDDDSNGYKDDYDGWNANNSNGNVMYQSASDKHGTHVAGTVGARGNNSVGLTGVNWNVKIMPISGSSGVESTVIEAYGYALEMRAIYNETNGDSGAFVVSTNSSFGVNFGQPADYPIWCAFYDSLGNYGILSAGATINQNTDVDAVSDIPTGCSSSYLIAVTNTTKNDTKNNAAGYGLTTIDLGAPGTDIWSTVPASAYEGIGWSGTSMATPHVAGAVALLYAYACEKFMMDYKQNPDSIALVMKDYILNGTDPIAALNGKTVTGGRLNLFNSVVLLSGYDCQLIGIDDFHVAGKRPTLYPNPAYDFVNILPGAGITDMQVEVLDVIGRTVQTAIIYSKTVKPNLLNLENLSKGIYLVRLYGEGWQHTERVILF